MTNMNKSKNGHRSGDAHPELRPQRRSLRLRRTVGRTEVWNLRFESTGTTVPAGLVHDSPTLLVAAVEDICWQAAAEGWRARRPRRWRRRAYAAWLDQKRQRLSTMVYNALATY